MGVRMSGELWWLVIIFAALCIAWIVVWQRYGDH